MKMVARVKNSEGKHEVSLSTNGKTHELSIAPKPEGVGSSVSGGELLFLALATCFCNDLYREAKKLGIQVEAVEVEVEGEFGREGEPAHHITYRAKVKAGEGKERLEELMRVTDRMAEIQNTLRAGIPVTLTQMDTF